MGADVFYEHCDHPDPDRAFREAHSAACHYNGNGGYTGTLAEKDDYTIIQREPVPFERAQQIAERMIDQCDPRIDDKWGPAGAIPYTKGGNASTRTVKVTASNVPEGYYDAQQLAAPLVKLRSDEWIRSAMALTERITRKTTTHTPPGQRETVYVVGSHQFRTLEEAKTCATEMMERDVLRQGSQSGPFTNQRNLRIAVEAKVVKRGEDGADLPLWAIENTIVKREIDLEVEICKVEGAASPIEGWLFFGWASC